MREIIDRLPELLPDGCSLADLSSADMRYILGMADALDMLAELSVEYSDEDVFLKTVKDSVSRTTHDELCRKLTVKVIDRVTELCRERRRR